MPEPGVGIATPLNVAFEDATAFTGWGTLPGTPKWYTVPTLPGRKGSGNRPPIKNELMSGDPNRRDSVLGRKTSGGDMSFYPAIKSAPWLTKWILGSLATTGTGDPYTHTGKITNSPSALPSAQLEDTIDLATDQYKIVTGARVASANMKFTVDGFLQWDVSYKGKDVDLAAAAVSATPTDWTSDSFLDHSQIAAADVKVNGSACTVLQEVDVTIEHELTEVYAIGQGSLPSGLVRGFANVSGSCKFLFTDTTYYDLAVAGTYTSVDITWTYAANRTLRLYLPRIRFEVNEPDITKEELSLTLRFEAAKDGTAATSCQIVVVNDQAGTVYA